MNLREQRAAAIKAAQSIIATAQAEERELTEDEQSEVEAHAAEVKQLATQIKRADVVRDVMALSGPVQPEPEVQPVAAPTLGEHYAQHAKSAELVRLKTNSGHVVAVPEYVPGKANEVTTNAEVYGPLLTDIDRTIVPAYRRPPVVADLLGSGTVSGNAITYFVEGAEGTRPTTVAEMAQKPQLTYNVPTAVTDPIRKIAGWFDMTDEMVEDLPFIVSEINNRALYMLAMVEEAQLLNGDGTGANITGLLERDGIQTEAATGAADNPDALFRAMMKVQTATGLAADGIVINPTDYQALRLARDGNNQYYGGGFFAGQYGNGGVPMQPPVWGLRTVVTGAVQPGTAVVGAFRAAATVYRKGGVRVETTNSDASKFTQNIVTTRIEERIGLAVRFPAAVVEVTLNSAA